MIEPISVAIGAVVAVALGVLIYSQRRRIAALQSSVKRGAASTAEKITKASDSRYRDAVIDLANGWHLAGHLIPLEHIAVMPRFYTPPPPFNPLEADERTGYDGPLTMVPFILDWQQAAAPYRPAVISVDSLLRGDDRIVLLGLPGSGRSTTLAMIAILAARQTEDGQPGGITERARLPVLIHLADMDFSAQTWGMENVDPLKPLLEAARTQMHGLAAHVVGTARGPIASGAGLILIDGWDEVPHLQQMQAVEWLNGLLETYPGNKVVVSAGVRGYWPLQASGFVPAALSPWDNPEYAELSQLWIAIWPEISEAHKDSPAEADADAVRRAMRGNRSRSPLDITLKLWAALAYQDPGQGRRGWYSSYINRTLPAPELRPALEQAAIDALSQDEATGITLNDLTGLIDQAKRESETRIAGSTPDFVYSISNETHLLSERPGKRVAFTHPTVAAYLAAEGLHRSPEQIAEIVDRPASSLVMPFLAQMEDVGPYVQARLEKDDTLLHEAVLEAALWAADAPLDAAWRGDLFKRLASYLLGPAEYPFVRERAMSALVSSRDRNVNFIFLQGTKRDDWRIRVLSILGLGASGDSEMVSPLGKLSQDPDPAVEAAAALALGAVGTKPALNYLIQILLTGSELARQAAAEMLALNLAGEGHDILKEALLETDSATRKAAVHGVTRVNEPWAFEELKKVEIGESQWMVKSAATDALEMLAKGHGDTLHRPPTPEETDWLLAWLADRDLSITAGPNAAERLVLALEEGDDATRLAAVEAFGTLALPEGITPLYNALGDHLAEIRDEAHRSLGAISIATGQQFPGLSRG